MKKFYLIFSFSLLSIFTAEAQNIFGNVHIITSNANSPYSAYATDIDGDGDLDVFADYGLGGAWYENNGAESFSDPKFFGLLQMEAILFYVT